MAELFITSDIITYVLAYIGRARQTLRAECGLSILEYRMLAFLIDHPDGIAPSQLSSILDTSCASVTLAANSLAEKSLVIRGGSGKRPQHLTASKAGIDIGRDADVVLATAHEEHFAVLPGNLKATVDIGSIVTNQRSPETRHIRDGHFFNAFETLHAFLIVEMFLTRSTHGSGLSLTQFRILHELGQRGSLPPTALADNLLLAPSSVTHALNGLKANKLIAISEHREDRRMRAVALTDEGRMALVGALERCEATLTTDIRSSTKPERDAYKDASSLIVATLRKQHRRSGGK